MMSQFFLGHFLECPNILWDIAVFFWDIPKKFWDECPNIFGDIPEILWDILIFTGHGLECPKILLGRSPYFLINPLRIFLGHLIEYFWDILVLWDISKYLRDMDWNVPKYCQDVFHTS